jgi:hypothetical protein
MAVMFTITIGRYPKRYGKGMGGWNNDVSSATRPADAWMSTGAR